MKPKSFKRVRAWIDQMVLTALAVGGLLYVIKCLATDLLS